MGHRTCKPKLSLSLLTRASTRKKNAHISSLALHLRKKEFARRSSAWRRKKAKGLEIQSSASSRYPSLKKTSKPRTPFSSPIVKGPRVGRQPALAPAHRAMQTLAARSSRIHTSRKAVKSSSHRSRSTLPASRKMRSQTKICAMVLTVCLRWASPTMTSIWP